MVSDTCYTHLSLRLIVDVAEVKMARLQVLYPRDAVLVVQSQCEPVYLAKNGEWMGWSEQSLGRQT
jgi:hypothetical protein